MTVTAAPTAQVRRARAAVAALFFANGALFANVVPRYPDLKAGLGLSNTQFGAAIAAYGTGALIAGLLAGVLVARWGSGRVALLAAVGIAANLLLLAVAPSWPALSAALFVAGSLDSVADIANNSHGLRVERRYGRSILVSMHGVWSIGAVVGGAMGAAAAGLRTPLPLHLGIAGALFGGLAAVAFRFLLKGPDGEQQATAADAPRQRRAWRGHLRIARVVVALGVVAGAGQMIEDTGATWSAVYLREDLGAAAAVAGLAFIALQALQTVGRLVGDRVVTRYGDRAVARGGALLAGGSMAAALAVPSPAAVIVAFGAAGLGIGTLIPASMRAADALPGLPPGVGLSLAGTVLRLALLVAPPVVGIVADATSLRVGLTIMPLAALAVLVLSHTLPAVPPRGRQA